MVIPYREKEGTVWEVGLGTMCKADIERFLQQHFVGKQFAHNPDAPECYAVFTDGTAVSAVNSYSGENCPMNTRHLTDAGVIERTWHEEEYVDYDNDTYTQRLYVQFKGDKTPHLIVEDTFQHEDYDDWDSIYLHALCEDDY